MKTLKFTFFVAMLAFVPMAFGQSTVKTATVKPADKKVQTVQATTAATNGVSWSSTTIDVGEIPLGKPHTIKFEFKNTDKKPVLITNVKASCGCTATDYTKDAIKPKKSGYVNATYNAAHEGAFTKTVTVTTSGSETPTKLTFKGKVVK